MEILIIGGTRNVGHLLSLKLLEQGRQVTVFNRGKTQDKLPKEIQRLHGDRGDLDALSRALAGKSFDVVVDMALYNADDAKAIAGLLDGRVGQYIFLSTGQIYLVREESPRPFLEEASQKPLLPAPTGTRDYEECSYGVNKGQAEDALMSAWQMRGFPVTTLRLPMVNSQRDHFHRIYGYLLRMRDGGPIVLPTGKHHLLRHVYADDVLQAIMRIIETGLGKGHVYNIPQEETLSLCSPFSDPWMSELDNQRSKRELGMQYTPLPVYLSKLLGHYKNSQLLMPDGYRRRGEELQLVSKT